MSLFGWMAFAAYAIAGGMWIWCKIADRDCTDKLDQLLADLNGEGL